MRKAIVRTIGCVGFAMFLPVFVLSFIQPNTIEELVQSFIAQELKVEVESKVDKLSLPISDKLGAFLSKKVKQLELDKSLKVKLLKEQLSNQVPSILAEEIANMRNLDCACREKWRQRIESSTLLKINSLESAASKLRDFTQAKYMEILTNLVRDIKIFSGANALVFLFLISVSLAKPKSIIQLFVPAVLLFISVFVCSLFYMFEQNWLLTLIYNDFTGYGYLVYLLVVFCFLLDIVFNGAEITTTILEAIFKGLKIGVEITPC